MVKKILVVDDDESILDAVALILRDEGYEVRATSKGEEACVVADSYTPDIILLDVLMSGVDGRNICKKLKFEEKTKNVPIIMISAHPSAHEDVFEYGADKFLAKPFDANDLLALIESY